MPPKNAGSLERGVNKNARKGTKSRSGCQTCKVKRLKCDETKPACSNCVNRGLQCPGYKQVLRWSTKYEASQSDALPQTTIHPSLEYQFSAIDPSSFGDVATDKAGETLPATGEEAECGRVEGSTESVTTAAEDNVANVTAASAEDPILVGTGFWQADIPDLFNSGESSLVPFEQQPNYEDESAKADYEVQRTSRPSQNTRRPSSVQWKTLLRSYYRMNPPMMPRSLQNEASALVEHYFRDVCVIFSCFDSAMNPFRTVIARLWDNSSSIFFAIQSMAAAHLANYMPQMRITGLTMQRKAYECLQQELQLASINQTMDDKLLLAVLLLGLSAGWHDSSDLGYAHLTAARALIETRLMREDDALQGTESTRNDQFFAEALIYWEMIMAFVTHETFVPGMERRLPAAPFEDQNQSPAKVFPHPWTGIAPRIQMLFAEVGRLVRHYCTVRHTFFDMDINAIIAAAQDLEDELLAICLPSIDDLVDVQDERTSKSDFICLAEATKCAALLEIYRVFPEILLNRMSSVENGDLPATFATFELNYQREYSLDKLFCLTSWLTSLAIHVLDILAKIPMSSGTRPIQVIVVVTSAAELRLRTPSPSLPGRSVSTSFDIKVAQARGVAMTRLNEMSSRLPSKPIVKIIRLIKEVWRRNDNGDDVFWMDVMTANGWETIMG